MPENISIQQLLDSAKNLETKLKGLDVEVKNLEVKKTNFQTDISGLLTEKKELEDTVNNLKTRLAGIVNAAVAEEKEKILAIQEEQQATLEEIKVLEQDLKVKKADYDKRFKDLEKALDNNKQQASGLAQKETEVDLLKSKLKQIIKLIQDITEIKDI